MGRFSDLVSSPGPQPEPQPTVQPEPEVVSTPVVEERIETTPQVDVYEELQKQSPVLTEEDLPGTPEEAIEKNLLFSKKKYLKQFEPEPESPKELNPGQSLFRYKLLEKPTETNKFTSKPAIRATKDPEQPFVPVEYSRPKTLRSAKTDVPVEEVAQDPVEPDEEAV